MTFIDRKDAGVRLAKALEPWRACRPVILALPRGGVPKTPQRFLSVGFHYRDFDQIPDEAVVAALRACAPI